MAAGRNLTLLMLMLTLCLGVFRDTPALAQASPAGRPGDSRSTQGYFTITGGVARPGVYPFPRQPLQLTELVREAGGLSELANNNVRIVRDGRAGLQTFYSDTSSYQLMPGDIVCVDERRAVPGTFGWNGRPVTGDPIRNPPMVNVTLINVLDRPVLLPLPASQATMFNLNRMLGQPQNSARPVQILNRAATGSRGATATSDMRLTNGTVIVFPAHAIQKHSLPPLPEPIRRGEPKPDANATADQDAVLPPPALNGIGPGALASPAVLPGATTARSTESSRRTEPLVTQIEVPRSFPLSAPQLTAPGNPLMPALTPPTRMTSQRTESPLPSPSALAAVRTPDMPVSDV